MAAPEPRQEALSTLSPSSSGWAEERAQLLSAAKEEKERAAAERKRMLELMESRIQTLTSTVSAELATTKRELKEEKARGERAAAKAKARLETLEARLAAAGIANTTSSSLASVAVRAAEDASAAFATSQAAERTIAMLQQQLQQATLRAQAAELALAQALSAHALEREREQAAAAAAHGAERDRLLTQVSELRRALQLEADRRAVQEGLQSALSAVESAPARVTVPTPGRPPLPPAEDAVEDGEALNLPPLRSMPKNRTGSYLSSGEEGAPPGTLVGILPGRSPLVTPGASPTATPTPTPAPTPAPSRPHSPQPYSGPAYAQAPPIPGSPIGADEPHYSTVSFLSSYLSTLSFTPPAATAVEGTASLYDALTCQLRSYLPESDGEPRSLYGGSTPEPMPQSGVPASPSAAVEAAVDAAVQAALQATGWLSKAAPEAASGGEEAASLTMEATPGQAGV